MLRRTTQLSGCVCIFLSWDEPRRSLIRHLRANGVVLEVAVITDRSQLLDPGPMRDQPNRFRVVTAGRLEEAFAGQ